MAFINSSTATEAFSASITVAKPVGTSAGHVLVAMLSTDDKSVPIATPAGWSAATLPVSGSGTGLSVRVLTRVAGPSEPSTYTFSTAGSKVGLVAVLLTYSHIDPTTPVDVVGSYADSGASIVTPSVTTVTENATVLSGFFMGARTTLTTPAGTTSRAAVESVLGMALSARAVDEVKATTGATVARTSAAAGNSARWLAVAVALRKGNVAPNAPTVSVPAIIDRAATNRISVPFSDDDPGDSQSKLDIQWWDLAGGSRVGAANTFSRTGPIQYWDSPASTFTLGKKESQARSYDSQGLVSPWSASAFFEAKDAPAAPTITYPINGGTVAQAETLTWSTPTQAAYQVQVLDGATVITDTLEVPNPSARSASIAFPDDGSTRTIQMRIKYNGLWSAWTSITVNVSFTPPATPVVTTTADPGNGSLIIAVTNPTPTGGQPAVAYNDVEINDWDGDGWIRKATMLATNTTWTYWTPRAGIATGVRVRAVATNDTTAESDAP